MIGGNIRGNVTRGKGHDGLGRIGRRRFLAGAGATVALPWLESLAPRAAQAADTPKRLLYWFIPNGVIGDRWNPPATGKLDPATLPPALQPLVDAGLTGDLSVLTGLDNLAGTPIGPGDHASGIAALLTCVAAKKAALSDLGLGISVDQVAAKAIGAMTARPSLELGMAASGGTGNCDNGYACAYAQSISWSDATTPRGKRTDPHDAWLYLLGNGATSLTAEQRARLQRGDKSVLDYVMQQTAALQPRLGAADRIKVDHYLTSLRTVEQQLTGTIDPTAACQMQPDPGSSKDYATRFEAMLEVMTFAFRCDLTRVITFMMGNAFGPGAMPYAGVPEDYHALTHNQGAAGVKDKILKCIQWEVKQVAAMMKRLKEIPEGDKTVLHNTSFLVTSDVGDGGRHNHDSLPVLLAGNGGGAFASGRHLRYTPEDNSARSLAATHDAAKRTQALAIPNSNKLANLHVSLLSTVGIDPAKTKVGDSTGPLSGLLT